MAKGSAMGIWRGKKGSSVFYKIMNSSNGQKQGIRERVYEVANPKSSSQAGQRMKMLPAQRFLASLSSVITRGFEGVEYGQASRLKFMQYALKMNAGYPAIDKDSNKVWPGEYLISRGQLPEVSGTFDESGSLFNSTLPFLGDATNVGVFSTALLSSAPWLQEGDQVTFVVCQSDDYGALDDAIPTYKVVSVILDKASTASIGLSVGESDAHTLQVVSDNDFFIGAGIIISREGNNGGHLRSNCVFSINPAFSDLLFAPSAYARARKSYMNSESSAATTDWPVEPGFTEDTYDSEYTLTGLTGNFAALNGQKAKVLRSLDNDNLLGYYYKVAGLGSNALVKPDGTPLSVTVEMEDLYLTAAQVSAFNGLTAVLFTEGA